MIEFLKQNTAITLKIGPFVDNVDGETEETALSIAQADVLLSKNHGALTQKHEATTCTHDANGVYNCPLDTTDTNTLQSLTLIVHKTGALIVRHDYIVLPANVFDALTGSDLLDVAVAEEANIDFGALKKASLNAAQPVLNSTATSAIVTAIFAGVLEGTITVKAGFLKLLGFLGTTITQSDGSVDFMSADGTKIRFTAEEGTSGREVTNGDLT